MGRERGGHGAEQSAREHLIMPKHKKDKRAKSVEQNFAPGRTGNPEMGGAQQEAAADNKAFQQHDGANRTGSFEGAGNHARTGNPGHQ